MKHIKLILIVLTAALMAACSSHKMGKMSSAGISPQTSSVAISVSAL
jgi:uncharacterized protein YcfL